MPINNLSYIEIGQRVDSVRQSDTEETIRVFAVTNKGALPVVQLSDFR